MKFSRARAVAVSSTAVAALLACAAQQASAQTLFDLLFKNDRRERVIREAPPEPAPVRRVAPPKVSGPSYYTYKTDALVKVDFAAIKPEREAEVMVPAGGHDPAKVGSTGASQLDSGRGDVGSAVQLAQAAQSEVASDAAVETAIDGKETPPTSPPETDGVATADEAVRGPLPEKNVATAEPGLPPEVSSPADGKAAVEPRQAPDLAVAAAPEPITDQEIASLQEFELLAEKAVAEAIVVHYTAKPEHIWTSAGAPNERARAALRTLGDAASHGLEPQDYLVSIPAGAAETDLARFEMELSARVLRYVRDARLGRIDPNRISGYHDFEPKPLDLVAVLDDARSAEDVAAFLDAQHPQNERYRALRVELEALRASAENEIVIAPKTLIKPGQTSAELPKILTLISRKADEAFRAEHGEILTRHLGSEVYVQELVAVIKAAQRANGLGDDGVVGPRTIQALAGDSKVAKIEKVEVALEQLRWLPSDFGDRYVFINAAAFNATYVEEGREKLSMRTIVGGLGTQTYFFQDEIEYVEFHPYWGVPKSILVNKYLPKLYNDPSYLDRAGFEVTDTRGQRVSSSAVNWGAYGANIPFDVRQKPGKGNALGELKIMFPNRHAIYMHDTPDRQLFDRDNRALSNGCVRLSDPRGMAAAVLGWSREQLDERLAQPHSRADLAGKVSVYVTYFTAWPTEAGEVVYVNDVYSRDEKVRTAIGKVEELRAPAV